ncbi:hypothetical protein pb186bvf_000851 [Paramecium bursaria]
MNLILGSLKKFNHKQMCFKKLQNIGKDNQLGITA